MLPLPPTTSLRTKKKKKSLLQIKLFPSCSRKTVTNRGVGWRERREGADESCSAFSSPLLKSSLIFLIFKKEREFHRGASAGSQYSYCEHSCGQRVLEFSARKPHPGGFPVSPAFILFPSLQRSTSNGTEEGACLVSDHEAKICTAGTLARWGAQGSATQGCTKLAGRRPEPPHTSQQPPPQPRGRGTRLPCPSSQPSA